jgi:hypothetical protein
MDYINMTYEERVIELRKYPAGANLTDEQLEHLRKVDSQAVDYDRTMNHYSRFLHDGDYEEFFPVPQMKKDSIEYLKMQIRMQEEKCRYLWLECRFLKFWSLEWLQNKSDYQAAHSFLRLMKGELEKRTTGKYTMQEPNRL